MAIVKKTVKAKYKGPKHPALESGQECSVEVTSSGDGPGIEIMVDGTISVGYPSKKKYLEHWEELEGAKVVQMPMPVRESRKKKESGISIADAGAVIYTELLAAVNRFNAKSVETYKDDPSKIAVFKITLQQQIYDAETQVKSKMYGAGVLMIEVKQFGLSRIVFQEGVSFTTDKELQNVNAYAPKLYINALNAFVESALMYILALNPDNPDNVKAVVQDGITKEEISTAPASGE